MKEAELKDHKLNQEEIEMWLSRIELAKEFQKKYGHGENDRWAQNVKAMAGDFNSKNLYGNEAVDVNIIRSTIDTSLPPLWINEPQIMVKPTSAKYRSKNGVVDNILNAESTQIELNYWMRELKFKGVLKKCVIDSEAFNVAYSYVGYVKKKIEIESDGERTEPLPQIEVRKPFIKRMSPRHVLLPPGIYDIEDAMWVALVFPTMVKAARTRYNNDDIKASARLWEQAQKKDDEDKPVPIPEQFAKYMETDDNGVVDIVEVWCKATKRRYTFAVGMKEELDNDKWPVDVEGFPVTLMRPIEIPDEYYGTPPMTFYMPQQIELNKARTATAIRENRSKAIIFIDSAIHDDVKEAYTRAADGGLIPVETGADGDLRKKIMVDPGLPPNTGAYAYGQVQMNDLHQVQGLGPQSRGFGDPNAPTATASANIDKWTIVRQTNRGDVVRTFILETVTKLWMVLKQFPDEKRDRLVPGSRPGQTKSVAYSLKDLHGEFAFSLDLASMMADDPSTRIQTSMALYNLLRADPLVQGDRLILDILLAMNKPNPEDYLVDLRSPDEEFMMIMQGLPVEADIRDDHEGHGQSHEVQMAKLEGALDQIKPDSQQGVQIRASMYSLMSHTNHHAKLVMEIQGEQEGPQPGKPIQGNQLRQQTAQAGPGGETPAEAGGKPLNSSGGSTPDGVPIN